MKNKSSYTHLLSKKMWRTIRRSPLQFLTMVLILGLASTLFSGLYASHLAFQDRVDREFANSNIADITSTLSYDYNKEGFDPKSETEQDQKLIENTVGSSHGQVEAQYNSTAKIRGLDAFISMTDSFPTINKPTEIKGKADGDDYFLFCDTYLDIPINYGERSIWVDDDGNYKPADIELSISSLKDRFENKKLNPRLKPLIDGYLKNPSNDPLKSSYITLEAKPTGCMKHPEDIASSSVVPYTFITTRTFIKKCLSEKLDASYDLVQLKADLDNADPGQDRDDLQEAWDLLNLGASSTSDNLMDRYWCNNRCVTRLNKRSEAKTYRDKITDAFTNRLSRNNLILNTQLSDTSVYQQLQTDSMQSLQLCFAFPVVFFLVSILIVLTTISQIILKERKEIGTLKAIGSSNRSIFVYYCALAGIVSLFGTALGLIAGPLLLPTLLDLKYAMLYTLPASRYIFPTVVAVGMAGVVLLITTLVTYLVARKEVKALPIISMRPKAVNVKKKNLSDSKEDNTHKLCFKMAVRNIFCSVPRSIMVVVGVLGCTALLCCGFGIDDSVNHGINNDIKMFTQTDALIYFSNQTQETFDEIENLEIDGQKMVTDFEPYGYLPVTASEASVIDVSTTTYVYSISRTYDAKYKFFNIGYTPHDKYIAVSNKVAKALGVHEGDLLDFNFLGKTYTGTIEKVIDVFYMHGIYIDGEYPNFPQTKSYPTCAYARFNKDVDKSVVIDAISKIGGVSNIIDRAELDGRIKEISSSIRYITTTIKVFAILLAVVSLYNLSLLNFKENTRNIATMKVLGFNRREVAESLFFEIIVLSSVGAIIGLGLGYPLVMLVLGINKVPMCEFFYRLSALSIIISLLITLGVSAIINIFVGLRVKKVKMVESLKSVE